MSQIKEMPNDERPRERLWKKGAESLRTAELLAILLRTGMRGRSALDIADELLRKYTDLTQLCRAEAVELSRVKGLGLAKAVQLKASFELAGRLAKCQASDIPVETPSDVQQLLGEELRQLPYESMRVLALNTRLKLMAMEEVSAGTVNETVAHPRDILKVGIVRQAYGIMIVHNHPSGDPSPSNADLDFTVRLREAARLMQIELVDHIILGVAGCSRPAYYSFKEAGYL
ncbi:MAG: DNA repair protein RadC [Methylacidiphilales bacterium]|nr:DNA repair protein RadC [Candidatus Methylacidiphilales bacterium]